MQQIFGSGRWFVSHAFLRFPCRITAPEVPQQAKQLPAEEFLFSDRLWVGTCPSDMFLDGASGFLVDCESAPLSWVVCGVGCLSVCHTESLILRTCAGVATLMRMAVTIDPLQVRKAGGNKAGRELRSFLRATLSHINIVAFIIGGSVRKSNASSSTMKRLRCACWSTAASGRTRFLDSTQLCVTQAKQACSMPLVLH